MGIVRPVAIADAPLTATPADVACPCPMPDELPEHIKRRYRTLALVTHRGQTECIDAADAETLIVCCDWLLWQQLIAAGRHAVYYELGLMDWTQPDDLDTELFVRATDFVYENGVDQTVFRGVSLGKAFAAELSMALMNYHRLNRALRKLVTRFRPTEVQHFDFRYDINVLDADLRKALVEGIVGDCGLAFTDRSDEGGPDGTAIAERLYAAPERQLAKDALRFIYTRGLEWASRFRCIFKERGNRVLVLLVANTIEPLVRGFPGGRLTPIVLGSTVPKKPGLLLRCLARGMLLVTPRLAQLDAADRARVAEIRAAVGRIVAHSMADGIAVLGPYIQNRILDSGRLEERARLVRSLEQLLDRYRPRRLVVDGVRNTPLRIYAELARARGIPVDYTWHAPWTPQSLKFDALGGDPRTAPVVTRCLSWGAINDAWLDRVGAKQPRIRVGCPIADRYRRLAGNGGEAAPKPPARTNVLLLQYTFTVSDIRGLNTNMYATFVNAVRRLREIGYRNIRYKMHPGPGRWTDDYFRRIAGHFGLDCEILRREPFEQCLAWADLVIGPMQTGAMFETLAAGKPYHALLVPPYSHDPGYYKDYPYYASVDELVGAFRAPATAAGRAVLEGLYSIDAFPSAARRFWQVMEEDATC